MAQTEAIAIKVVIEPGEPLSGTLRVEGHQTETRFSGWMELMVAVSAIRISARPKSNEH